MKPINPTPSSWDRGARLLRHKRTLAGAAVVVLAVTTGCSSAASSSSSSAAGMLASAAASGSSASGPAVAGWAQALAAYAAYTGSKPGQPT